MPTQRLSYGALAAAGGGIVLIIALFIDWIGEGGFGANAWDLFSLDDIVLLVLGLLAIALAALELPAVPSVRLPVARPRALTTVGIIATTIVWAFLFEADHLKFGFFLAGIASLAILAGGILLERRPDQALVVGAQPISGGAGAPGADVAAPGAGQPPLATSTPQVGASSAATVAPPSAADTPTAPMGAAAAQPVSQSSPAPPDRPGTPADWYPDPKGEKRLRYWDGSQWTDHVAD